MAVPTLGTLGYTSLSTAESTTGWVKFDLLETDIKKEGSNSITGTFRADGTEGYYDSAGAPITAVGKHVRLWVNTTNLPYMATEAGGGYQFYMFDGTTTEYVTIFGSDTYEGGWFNMVLDCDAFTTLTLANVDRWGMLANHAISAKNVDNMWVDALKYMDGYSITGGLTGDRVELADIASADNSVAAYGIVLATEGVYFGYGEIQFGSGATTTWVDMVGEVLIFTDQPVAAGLYKLTGIGTGCRVNIDGSVIKGGGTTAATRFVLDMSDADLLVCTITNNLIVRASTVTFKSGQTITGNTFDDCGQITPTGADISGSSVDGYEGATDSAALIYNEATDPNTKMTGMSFTKGTAATHAIEYGTSIPASITLDAMTFAGYTTGTSAALNFLDTSGTITVNLVNGTTDVSASYQTAGATIVFVISPVTVTVTARSTSGVLEGARVMLKASDGTGPLPFEDSVTISVTTLLATVTHTAHGMATGQQVEILGATNNLHNGPRVITVTTANAYTYVTSAPDGAAAGTITSTGVVIHELTNASGVATETRSFATDQPVDGWVRKSTAPGPFYVQALLSGVINATAGFSATSQMVFNGNSVPGAPTALTGSVGTSGEVNLGWTAPAANGGSAITDYLIEYKTAVSGTWLSFAEAVSTATTRIVTGLTDDTAYDFRVLAVNAEGSSAPSTDIERTPASGPSLDVGAVGTVVGGTSLALALPSGYSVDSEMLNIAVIHSTNVAVSVSTPPSGWTAELVISSTDVKTWVYSKRFVASTPHTWTFDTSGDYHGRIIQVGLVEAATAARGKRSDSELGSATSITSAAAVTPTPVLSDKFLLVAAQEIGSSVASPFTFSDNRTNSYEEMWNETVTINGKYVSDGFGWVDSPATSSITPTVSSGQSDQWTMCSILLDFSSAGTG